MTSNVPGNAERNNGMDPPRFGRRGSGRNATPSGGRNAPMGRNADVDPRTGMQVDPRTGMQIDPRTGMQIDPRTGMQVDPSTGMYMDPKTGAYVDPRTGRQVDPSTLHSGQGTGSGTGEGAGHGTGAGMERDATYGTTTTGGPGGGGGTMAGRGRGGGAMAYNAGASGRVSSLPWWVYLVIGTAWLVLTWIALRFNIHTIRTIGVLAGVFILVAAAFEILNVISAPSWKWLHAVLALLFIGIGIVAIVHPGDTFAWMAAFIGWYLLFKGAADIFFAFAYKDEYEAWWLQLITGIVQLGFGFWAAGHFQRSAYVLALYVAIIALTHAISDISTAFHLRRAQMNAGIGRVGAQTRTDSYGTSQRTVAAH